MLLLDRRSTRPFFCERRSLLPHCDHWRHFGHDLLSAVARPITLKKLERLDHNHADLDEFDGATYVAIGQKLPIGITHLRRERRSLSQVLRQVRFQEL